MPVPSLLTVLPRRARRNGQFPARGRARRTVAAGPVQHLGEGSVALVLPSQRTPERPPNGDTGARLYVRSYLLMRLVIGVVGVLLPVLLLVGDWWFVDGRPTSRGSLSAYYHSGMRDVFVAALAVIGVFLLTYMAFHYNWDNVLSMVAGVAAVGTAMFPTDGGEVLTPLQRELGESLVAAIHYTCAGVFILSLAAISWRFGTREHARPDRTANQQHRWWLYHRACAVTVVGAVAFIVLTQATGVWDRYSILVGETVAALAFGLSWFVKGAELDVLLGKRPAQPEPAAG